MPHESCVTHPKRDYFLCTRTDYLGITANDHCAAALLSLFEFLTNGALDQMSASGGTGDPWIAITRKALSDGILGLFSSRTISDSLRKLEDLGFIAVRRREGDHSYYLLRCEAITAAMMQLGPEAYYCERAHPVERPVQSKADNLEAEAFTYLKEIEHWTERYNEIAIELRALGYYQAGNIPCWGFAGNQQSRPLFHHTICPQSEEHFGSACKITADAFITSIANGPRSQHRHFTPKQNSSPGPKRNRRSAQLAAMGEKASWICPYCQQQGDPERGPDGRGWHIDHLYARARGGDNRKDNLILACATCNLKKNRRLASEFLAEARTKIEPESACNQL